MCPISQHLNGHIRRYDIDLWYDSENVWISVIISLKIVPNGPVNNKSSLVQVMDRRPTDDKPLSEPTMSQLNDVYMRDPASM